MEEYSATLLSNVYSCFNPLLFLQDRKTKFESVLFFLYPDDNSRIDISNCWNMVKTDSKKQQAQL
jgi:hypothetical protein